MLDYVCSIVCVNTRCVGVGVGVFHCVVFWVGGCLIVCVCVRRAHLCLCVSEGMCIQSVPTSYVGTPVVLVGVIVIYCLVVCHCHSIHTV